MTPLSFQEAKAMGEALFDRWQAQSESPPPFTKDDAAWPDLARVAFERLRAERSGS